jgi:hypothetical protein
MMVDSIIPQVLLLVCITPYMFTSLTLNPRERGEP